MKKEIPVFIRKFVPLKRHANNATTKKPQSPHSYGRITE